MSRKFARVDLIDPETRVKIHKQQGFWQILLPIILFSIIAIAAAVLLSLRSASMPQFKQLADLITIFLVLLLMLSLLLGLLIPILLIVGLMKLSPRITVISQMILNFVLRVKQGSQTTADMSVNPIIKARAGAAKFKKLFESLFPERK